ncbi:arsenate reductase family protein [Desulfocucumis palustris]|uniref:Arsenate reductase family protein n=1 Tax=Desulfocucumis palustris TaxID=1898651 RepID=A0A2L2XCX4_9FIRM|nr:arsenate reductase family protein [Desulfocucumis palustris]
MTRSGLEAKKLLNTSGREYRAMGKETFAAMSKDELLAALAANGMLLKRPVLTDGERALVGFKEEAYRNFFKL